MGNSDNRGPGPTGMPCAPEDDNPGLKKRLLPWLLWSQVIPAPLVILAPEAVAPAGAVLLGLAAMRAAPSRDRAKGLLGLRRPSAGWLRMTLALLLPILTWSRLVSLPLALAVPGGEATELPPGSLLTLVVFVPFFEELLFRGLLLELWRPKGRLIALCLTALLFALGHGLWLLPSTLLIGWFLGWLAWEYNSIWPAFLVHAANNLFSTLLGRFLAVSPEAAAAGAMALGIILFGGLVLSFRIRPQMRVALLGPWREIPSGMRRKTVVAELVAALRLWPVAVVVALCLVNLYTGVLSPGW